MAGLLLGGSLIIPIGAQNAFVLERGIRRNHPWVTAGICAGCDMVLVSTGVLVGGRLLSEPALWVQALTWAGIAFVLSYAYFALRRAFRPQPADHGGASGRLSLRRCIAMTLAVTLLNPHVYLDTVLVMGNLAKEYPTNERRYFLLGALTISWIWFFGLAGLASKWSKQLQHPRIQRLVDLGVAAIMIWVAATLVRGLPG